MSLIDYQEGQPTSVLKTRSCATNRTYPSPSVWEWSERTVFGPVSPHPWAARGINIVTKLGMLFALVVVFTLFSFYLGLFMTQPGVRPSRKRCIFCTCGTWIILERWKLTTAGFTCSGSVDLMNCSLRSSGTQGPLAPPSPAEHIRFT